MSELDFADEAPPPPPTQTHARAFRGARAIAERELVSACMSDHSGEAIALCCGLSPSIIQDREAKKIFKAIAKGLNGHSVADLSRDLEIPMGNMTQIQLLDPEGVRLSANLQAIVGAHQRPIAEALGRAITESAGTFPLPLAAWQDELTGLQKSMPSSMGEGTDKLPQARGITSFKYPLGTDSNTLLGQDDYLGRGGGMLFVSHAGAGKSSWIMDAAMSWATGTPWMGIKSHGPLKTLIIQAEDSDRYVGKVAASFVHARQLTADQAAQVDANVQVVRLKGVSGASFYSALRAYVSLHEPDLVVINPIYMYAEGDISKSEYAQPFLVSLDAVNRDERFAYILIHHTGKPQARGQNGKRATLDDWESVYMGFGSSYLANWPRCSALLEPRPGHSDRFSLRFGKGGLNAGVTKEVDQGAGTRLEKVTRIAIRHSAALMPVEGQDRPVYFWELDDEILPDSGEEPKGAPKKFDFPMFRECFPSSPLAPERHQVLWKKACQIRDIPESTFRNVIREAVDVGALVRIADKLGFKYHLPVV